MILVLLLALILLLILPVYLIRKNIKIFANYPAESLEPSMDSGVYKEIIVLAVLGAAAVLGLISLAPFSPFFENGANPYMSYSYFGVGESMSRSRILIRVSLLLLLFFVARRALKLSIPFQSRSKIERLFLVFQILGLASYYSAFLNGVAHFNIGWGRPLRVNGHETEPELTSNSKWTLKKVDTDVAITSETKRALEALWLRDAKKEFASIPAFSKLCGQLAAYGASPQLLKKVNLACGQEIEHAHLCFSMASAYGDSKWSASSIPQLINVQEKKPSLEQLIRECLTDGCIMESFNADVAAEGLKIVQDEETSKVMAVIARDEKFHGNLSWEILEFLLSLAKEGSEKELWLELQKMENLPVPAAYPQEIVDLVEAVSQTELSFYGRIPQEDFPALWKKRLELSRTRLMELTTSAGISEIEFFPPQV